MLTYGPLFGFDQENAIRIARGFGGGMARLSETCGAVTGSFMVLSLKYSGTDKKTREDNYALIQEFADKFKAAHGSLNCGMLIGCDLNTSEGQNYFRENDIIQSHCTKYVRHAVEIIESLILLK